MLNYGILCVGLYLLICAQVVVSKNKRADPRSKQSLVEVRAVYINCESDGRQDNLDNPILRFERQELFKHNALRDCHKKLALTVKIASPDPSGAETTDAKAEPGDEYIPIDHVLEGTEKKRVRLLNPYILRLRREMPKQAYKLHRIDTVSGVLTRTEFTSYNYAENTANGTTKRQVNNRERRDLDASEEMEEKSLLLGSGASVITLEHENPNHHSYSVRIGRLQELIKAAAPAQLQEHAPQDCGLRLFTPPIGKSQNPKSMQLKQKKKSIVLYENDIGKDKREVCPKTNSSLFGREKRQNLMMTMMDEAVVTPRYIKGRHHHSIYEGDNHKRNVELIKESRDEEENRRVNKEKRHGSPRPKDKIKHSESHSQPRKLVKHRETTKRAGDINEQSFSRPGGEFALYEIGDPNLWYDIKVHLFEKLSTQEGKTVWNDLTQGVDASVSSANPEWKGQDVNVRYKPAEWVPRDDFMLSASRLCLLEPLCDNDTVFDDEPQQLDPANQNYIVVPIEDVVYVDDKLNVKKRDDNVSGATANGTNGTNTQKPRRVEVRVARAILGSGADSFDIARLGADRFLTLPHRRPHHSQIDVEVRADDNVLVRVGSSGRLTTVVTDNTRKKRTTVYFQATNTGLASARFKAVIRECGPELSTQMKEKGGEEISSEPILLAPYHTQRMKLEVPAEIPTDVAHCNVALVNDKDVSVAVRDFSIKKGDRCFCVWHCECVCLSDDPKLLCREMSQPQQVAAGLAVVTRPRHARSVCYKDNMALDFVSMLISVLIFLLLLGLFKAFVGVWSVRAGQFGWERVLGTPRIIPYYFEPCLRNRTVVYRDGWPVHPETNNRCVRVLNCPASFLLNLVFFIIVPCLAIYGLFRACVTFTARFLKSTSCKIRKVDKQIYSAHDLQGESLELIVRRKKKNKLSDWMTPEAELLTADIMTSSLEPALAEYQMDEMQPLLHKTNFCTSEVGGAVSAVPDSEQEDTDYVLMQMQKSRESLARSQKK